MNNTKQYDKRATLKKYYDFFQTKINQEPSFAINMLEGVKYEFTDKTIRKNNMYGDVRLDLQQFYQAYIFLYYNNIKKTFNPEGVKLITSAVKRLPPEWRY